MHGKAVAGHFMTACGNALDQVRIALGHPAQSEEGTLDPSFIPDVEQDVSIAHHPMLAGLPVLTAIDAVKGLDLEVVLNVHGQGVEDGRGGGL